MNKIFIYTVLFIGFATLFSCTKSSVSATQSIITAKVNGKTWSANTTNITFNKVPTLHLFINGSADGTAINFDMNPYTGIGTYQLTASNNAYYATNVNSSNKLYNHADSGKVIITDSFSDGGNRTIIKGKFYFVTDNNFNISEGEFSVALDLN